MTVLLLARYVPPRVDAVGDYTVQLARALAEQGLEVVIVTSTGPVAASPHPRVQIEPIIERWTWGGCRRVAAVIRRQRADVLNLQFVPHLYGRYGVSLGVAAWPLLLRIWTGCPVVTTCHELLGHRPSGIRQWLLQGLYGWQAFLIMAGSRVVVVPAVWQETQLRRTFPWWASQVRRIPVGPSIPPSGSIEPAPFDAPAVPPRLTLVTFGAGHPWWQYERALVLLKAVREAGLSARLICLGAIETTNPVYAQRLRAHAQTLGLSERVEWSGALPPEAISRVLHRADLFLAFQRAGVTARSTAVVTALAHGLPIVATCGPDADAWLLESGGVIAVDLTDWSGTVRTVVRLLRDPAARQRVRDRAAALYRDQFAWDVLAQRWADVFEAVRTNPEPP